MDFTLSEDNLALRDSAASFIEREWTLDAFLRPEANDGPMGYGPIWSKIQELGWLGLAIPESYGGLGMDYLDLSMIVGELGRGLVAAPYFGTLAGAWAIERAGSEEQKRNLLPRVAAGELTLALAIAGPQGDVDGEAGTVKASCNGSDWTLDGEKSFVVDAASADKLIVAAMEDGRQIFFLVDTAASGVTIERLDWRDPTREVCRVGLSNVAAERLEQSDEQSWPWVRDRLYLVLAVESAAGTEKVLADAVAYAKERVAFGRPIGAFQAIKHSLADVSGLSVLATAGGQYASWALDEDEQLASKAVLIAQSYASEAYREATHRNIQIFGGMGFTWEMPNHLYYKRARTNAELLGAPRVQREQLIQLLGADRAKAA